MNKIEKSRLMHLDVMSTWQREAQQVVRIITTGEHRGWQVDSTPRTSELKLLGRLESDVMRNREREEVMT